MSFGTPDLSSEPYFVFFLSGLAEIPGILIAWIAMERLGRRSTVLYFMLLSGILSTATAFLPGGEKSAAI